MPNEVDKWQCECGHRGFTLLGRSLVECEACQAQYFLEPNGRLTRTPPPEKGVYK